MRIGVDATSWQNNRGYGRHARALLRALVRLYPEHGFNLFLDSADVAEALPPDVQTRLVGASAPTAQAASSAGRRSIADMWRVASAISAEPLDVVLFPTIYSYVPVWTGARKIVVIHDVIAETYPELTMPRLAPRLFWKAKVALGRWQADALVTVSQYSRMRLVEYFGLDPERVFVVGEAADPVFRVLPSPVMPQRFDLHPDQRTVIYVGGFGPHKNLIELVDSFARIAREPGFADLRLLMVGEYRKEVFHSYYGVVKARIAELGIEDRVIFPGYVSDEDLVHVLNLGTVLVLPSLMEGFGLPAVEAAACGCPVIATKASPLPDLLGGGGIYIEPGRGEIEDTLRLVLTSEGLRSRMRQAGLAAAGRLTWDAAARQMMAVMEGKAVLECPAR